MSVRSWKYGEAAWRLLCSVIVRKINIFTSVQRVIRLFYKRSCFVCFLFFQLDPERKRRRSLPPHRK